MGSPFREVQEGDHSAGNVREAKPTTQPNGSLSSTNVESLAPGSRDGRDGVASEDLVAKVGGDEA